jgi:hypothetical protein
MRINQYYFLIPIAILILFGYCSNPRLKENRSMQVFHLKDISRISTSKLSDLGVIDIQYIPLETDSSNQVKQFIRIETDNNSFFISDLHKISKYASDGKYITNIGKRGRGPNEYNFVIDFSIDTLKDEIYILNGNRINCKINIYSFDGEFIKSFSSPKYTSHLNCVNNMLLCYLSNVDGIIETSYILINNNGEIEKIFPNKYPYKEVNVPRGFQSEFLFYSFNNQLYTKEIYSDTIFIFDSIGFSPAYILDFGIKPLSPELREHISNFEEFIQVSTQTLIVRSLLETNDFIYAEFTYNKLWYSFIRFKNRVKYFLLNTEQGIINDIDGGPNIKFRTTKNNNTILSWINAYELKAYVKSDKFRNFTPRYPEKKKKLEKLAASLNENDNPVLILVKLKE